jgi:hypothetical protein
LQTFDGRVDDVSVMNMTGAGIAWSNNRVTHCAVSNCGGPGIATLESPDSDTYTDGFCLFNVVTGCAVGVSVQQAGGWLVEGNHVYYTQADGMLLGDMWNTKVVGNHQWGQSPARGVYRAINGYQYPSCCGMNVLMGNVIDVQLAPGNPGSGLEGISLGCQAGATATWTASGWELAAGGGIINRTTGI